MGEGTDAARAEVLAARSVVGDEVEQLEAAARAAADIPAKVRRNPVRTAGLAAGAGFLLVGGPGRLFRGVRRAVLGPPEPLPKTMLPKEVEKTLKKLGSDGEKVRGTLQREFAQYLEETQQEREKRDLTGVLALILTSLARPAAQRIGKQLAQELVQPDGGGFEEQLAKIRDRRKGQNGNPPSG